jgi:hypothetical protein
MKYTQAFEKYWSNTKGTNYWSNTKGTNFRNLEGWQWEEIKHIAFLAWKAGIKHERGRY